MWPFQSKQSRLEEDEREARRIEEHTARIKRSVGLIDAASPEIVDIAETAWDHVKPLPFVGFVDGITNAFQIAESLGLIKIKKQQKEGK